MARTKLHQRLIPLALMGLAFAAGCAAEDGTSVNSRLGGKGEQTASPAPTATPGANPTGTATPTPSPTPTPTPSPTPSPSPDTTVVGGTDNSGGNEAIPTLPPVEQPSPSPTPVGALGMSDYVAGAPKALAFLANTERPWVVRNSDLVELNNGQISRTYASGLSQPSLIAAAGEDLWVVDGTTLHHLTAHAGGMSEGNLSSVATYPIDPGATGLAADETEAWVTHSGGTLTRIVVATGAKTTFSVTSPTAVSLDATNAWVTGSPDKLYRVTRSNGTIAPYTVGSEPVAVVADGQGGAWTANKTAKTISHLISGAVTSFNLSSTPRTLALNGSRIWVGATTPNQTTWLALDGTVQGATNLPMVPTGMAVDAVGRVWFCDPAGNTVVNVWGR